MQYAIVTDIHANWNALKAVDEKVREIGKASPSFTPPLYWCLGDIVGYGPDPIKCLTWLRYTSGVFDTGYVDPSDGPLHTKPLGSRWVPGNHDEWLLSPTKVHPDALASLRQHRQKLEAPEYSDLREWFQTEIRKPLATDDPQENEPRSLVVEQYNDLTAVYVHASAKPRVRRSTYLNVWEPSKIESDLLGLRQKYGETSRSIALFCGHTHYPMFAQLARDGRVRFKSIRYEEPKRIRRGLVAINPGSVGQPRDGDPRAAFAILDTDVKTVTFYRVKYDVEATAYRMRALEYPEDLVQRLVSADGRGDLQRYSEVYRRPRWCLRATGRR